MLTPNLEPTVTVRYQLAMAHHICAHLGLTDHTYTHLSARDDTDPDVFFIMPFGLMFHEVTPENLLRVRCDGHVLEGPDLGYNVTGYAVHSPIYQSRPDIHAIMHIHTPAMVAVSALAQGLLPLSQWGLHFYDHMGYHDYSSLALSIDQTQQLVQNLGPHNALLLRHHGGLFCGPTLQAALLLTYMCEKACQTQVQILSMNQPYLPLPPHLCAQAAHDLLTFEPALGQRDWAAWVRLLGPTPWRAVG